MLRFELYRQAMERYVANGSSGPFPLESHFASQRPATFYPGLDSRLLHDKSRFEWVHRLEAAWTRVTAELDALLCQRVGFVPVYEQYTKSGAWAACFFSLFGDRVKSTYEYCPETAELLESIPGAVDCGTALFSALAPETEVAAHCGNSNFKLRCQLPLRVPDGCGFKLGGEDIIASERECFIFDDSFLHSVWNPGTKPRFTLIFDIYHPDLTLEERTALEQLTFESDPRAYYLKFIESGRVPEWVYDPRVPEAHPVQSCDVK